MPRLYLMAAHEQLQAIVLQKALRDIRAKGDANAALAGRAAAARLRVAPQQLAHQALLWRLSVGEHKQTSSISGLHRCFLVKLTGDTPLRLFFPARCLTDGIPPESLRWLYIETMPYTTHHKVNERYIKQLNYMDAAWYRGQDWQHWTITVVRLPMA